MVYILEIISLADFRHLGLLCGGGPAQKIIFFFGNFFSTCEKNNQFLEFCKDQGGKISLETMTYCSASADGEKCSFGHCMSEIYVN